jgi:hypothetical protein
MDNLMELDNYFLMMVHIIMVLLTKALFMVKVDLFQVVNYTMKAKFEEMLHKKREYVLMMD